jgi:tRNA threonylcarbamoyladenosine biosynthesis protein TsaE
VEYHSRSVAETEAIAAKLAESLQPGDVVTLDGELGAGKTQFVRGIVKALGGDGKALGGDGRAVSSPTFVLLNVYQTPLFAVYHLDAYRVGGAEDFAGIGFSELLEQGGVVVVEWPGRVQEILPHRRVNITFQITGKTTRTISVT